MLQLILGRSGAGKTQWIHEKLRSMAGQGSLILLVPEQDSFAHERALLELLGERRAGEVEVLSFTRLGEILFRSCGGAEGRGLSDAQRAIAMSLALDAARDKVSLFARADEGLIPGLLRLRGELSAAGSSPDAFALAAKRTSQEKLCELALIMQVYDAILDGRFGGHGDAMLALYEALGTPEGRAYLADKTVAIDSFVGFTPQEMRILGRVMEHSQGVYVTLCLNELYEQPGESDIFSHTRRTAAGLMSLAKQAGIPVMAPLRLETLHRFVTPALAALEEAFLAPAPLPREDLREHIGLCVCEDLEAECTLAAARIKALLRGGMRCRDIAVLARDATPYEQPLYAAFRRVGVPLFEDRRQPVASQPLIRMVLAALEIAEDGFSLDAVMRWLKAGLAGFADDDIALLEDYVLLWRINGNAWLREWKAHPQGLGEAETERSDLQLSHLNLLRRRATAPLAAFRDALRDCSGIGGAAAVDALLQGAHIPVGLKKLRAALDAEGRPVEAAELCRVWDLLTELLDQVAEGLGEQAIGGARFAALLRLILSQQTLGQLPQSLDAVTFGAADRIRLQSPKTVFILGFNDEIFPRTPPQNSLVSDRERLALQKADLVMQDTAPLQLDLERLIVYRSLTAAREQLHISWALRNAAGEELRPSSWLHWLRERFPGIPVEESQFLPELTFLEGESAGFTLLCAQHGSGSALYAALREYFSQKPGYASRLAALERTAAERPSERRIDSPEVARTLFRNAAYFSPSRAEKYARCAFSFYCQYGLKAKSRSTADYNPLFRGNVLHSVLEQAFRQHSTESLLAMDEARRRSIISGLMDEYAARYLSGEHLPARVSYLYRRLRSIAANAFERLIAALEASEFRPVAFEMAIDMDQPVKPLEITLSDGTLLRMGGKADRIDCAVVDGRQYFRVIDYKSGSKQFSLGEVFDGLNLQMLAYLFALWQSKAAPFDTALPAGILYEQIRDPVLTAKERSMSQAQLERAKQDITRAEGFVLEDAQVLCAMEAGGCGIFLPAQLDSSGKLEKNVISLARLGKLKREVDMVLAQAAEGLRQGKIPALPLQSAKYSPCAYCEFQAICGFEPGQKVRQSSEMEFEEALEELDRRYPDENPSE